MSPVTDKSVQRYYIPMQAVLRPTSTTTKMRVVFNASAKTSSGKSLNDILHKGPSIQPELFDALVRFRSYSIAFTADIAKMYRCILLHPSDRPMQSILWREHTSAQFKEFELNTVTYRTKPASFLATKCLSILAESTENENVRKAIQNNFYMDDLLVGASSLSEAIELQKEVHTVLKSASLNLRKYQSNSSELLKTIPQELIETESTRTFGKERAISLLGLHWIPSEDQFAIKIPDVVELPSKVNKCALLSEVAKIFDPLGLISPATIREKLFIQQLWQEGLKWDQPVLHQLAQKVRAFHHEWPALAAFVLPRCVYPSLPSQPTLIGFADASNKAFCAVVHMQSQKEDQSTSSRIICAKTRVAPLKGRTVPKLQLCAALLLA